MNAVLLSLAAFYSTSAGGLLALRCRERLHHVLGFTAGMLLGVVSFELLPETFELARRLGGDGQGAMVAMVAGFLLLHGLQRHPAAGAWAACALVAHSVVDGIGIGLAFQVSPAMGLTVAIAVIAHDFCDGINTMSIMLLDGSSPRRALGMLALDALAPVAGALSTLAFSVPPGALVVCLGFFSGFLLCIGVAHILPKVRGLLGLTALGASLPYVLAEIAR